MTAGRTTAAAPAFDVGQRVRVRAADPPHHTRVPRYVRGHTGVVRVVQHACPLPDDEARRRLPVRVLPVYTVAFAAGGLWAKAPADPRDEVLCDLWECYLENDNNHDNNDQGNS
ncbi:SH3-like domain-containing protein [Streptomyces sp. NPDC006668]|uniref:SH3-like domain-containing protein n=1 Tax=Streptomyces sp. NPDC006668 TaxID=3156903 RepID=UPI0033D32FB7